MWVVVNQAAYYGLPPRLHVAFAFALFATTTAVKVSQQDYADEGSQGKLTMRRTCSDGYRRFC